MTAKPEPSLFQLLLRRQRHIKRIIELEHRSATPHVQWSLRTRRRTVELLTANICHAMQARLDPSPPSR